MRGAFQRTLMIALTLTLLACSNRSVDTEFTRCSYPDSPRTPAPSFLCEPNIPGFPVTVLRSSEPSELPVSERIERVFDDQTNQWARDLSQQWFDDSVQRTISETFLIGWIQDNGRVVRSRTSPKSYLWLLVGLPMEIQELEVITRAAVTSEAR